MIFQSFRNDIQANFPDISESLGPALLSFCHLDSQYIEEDVTHEENAAAEKKNNV